MSLWDNEDAEPWDKEVPLDLIAAVKFLRESFDTAHSMAGILVTMPVCYFRLHDGLGKWNSTDIREQQQSFDQIKALIGLAGTKRFDERMAQNTLPAKFAAFFGIYLEAVMARALHVFDELSKIGSANESLLDVPYLEWAEAQTKLLIRYHRHNIQIWVREVCDDTTHERVSFDPAEDSMERYWNTWRAPAFLIMKPSRHAVYEPTRIWDRVDSKTSKDWLRMFADHYVLILESAVRDAAGLAAVELAKHPKPVPRSPAVSETPPKGTPPLNSHASISQNPRNEFDRKGALITRLGDAGPEGCFRSEEAALVLSVSQRTINRKVETHELTEGPKRGTVTAKSLKKVYEALFGRIE